MPPGGGGLVILPKKSWNVWSYENRERVRRDEAAAKEDEKARQARSDAADQEVRLERMRARAATARGDAAVALLPPPPPGEGPAVELEGTEDGARPADVAYPPLVRPPDPVDSTHPPQHINLFSDLESGKRKRNGVSAAKAEEQRREEEATLKKVGALVYLGQSVLDAESGPWYAQGGPLGGTADGSASTRKRKLRRTAAQAHSVADPMAAMRKHVKAKSDREHARRLRDAAAAAAGPTASLAAERAARERAARRQAAKLLRSPAGLPNTPADHDPTMYSSTYSHFHHVGHHRDRVRQQSPAGWDEPARPRSKKAKKAKKSKKDKRDRKDKKRKDKKKSHER